MITEALILFILAIVLAILGIILSIYKGNAAYLSFIFFAFIPCVIGAVLQNTNINRRTNLAL